MFTAHPVTRVSLAPAGPGAWTASCLRCPRHPLHGEITLAPPVELYGGGPLRALDLSSGLERTTAGLWHIKATGRQPTLDIIVEIPSERYVRAVLNAEAASDEPPASLEALAIVARTFALNGRHDTAPAGRLPADLCDSTACQAIRFAPTSAAVQLAVRNTAGETLWFRGKRAQVFFSQHCGGITEVPSAIAPQLRSVPYLPSHPDPYCLRQGPAAWHADLTLPDLSRLAAAEGWALPRPLSAVRVSRRSSSGRALVLTFNGPQGPSLELPATAFRLALGRLLGWNQLRSDLYQLSLHGTTLAFDGRGHGHGVGLCQAGAREMAREGRSAREILAFYFPGTAVRLQPADDGWIYSQLGEMQIGADHALSASERSAVQAAWARAASLFPLKNLPRPLLFFAPSTELFRQLTEQPGWDLASTRGNLTVLQPAAILAAQHQPLQALLLHEFLHQRVEAEATDRAPLWLREGLVETLAGERSGPDSSLPGDVLDQRLQNPGSRAEAQAAHHLAAARVQSLERRYSPSAARGWLISGVPAEAAR